MHLLSLGLGVKTVLPGLYRVEGLLIVNECYTEWYVEFAALLLQLIYDMDVFFYVFLVAFVEDYHHLCMFPGSGDSSF